MPFLLDTNIVSDLVHDPRGRVARAIERVGEAEVATSVIVAAELRYGIAKKRSPRPVHRSEQSERSARIKRCAMSLATCSFDPYGRDSSVWVAALAAQVEAILGALPILPLDAPADRHYGELRAALERAGRLIGPNDLLIAAHALALGWTLVTDNVGELERIPGLVTCPPWRPRSWLEPSWLVAWRGARRERAAAGAGSGVEAGEALEHGCAGWHRERGGAELGMEDADQAPERGRAFRRPAWGKGPGPCRAGSR